MPKTPPAVTIRADVREDRSGIPALLSAMPDVTVLTETLPVGDYLVGGSPEVAIERKSNLDFAASLTDGRLFAQLDALRSAGYRPILLIEGFLLSTPARVHPNAIRGAAAYIAGVLEIPLIVVESTQEAAALIFTIAKQQQTGYAIPTITGGRRVKTLKEQQRAVLMALPAIGPALADALLARFGTVQAALSASIEDLSSIPGITRRRAEHIHAILHAPLRPHEEQ
jgi:DNA excision repair protein ERCC-4